LTFGLPRSLSPCLLTNVSLATRNEIQVNSTVLNYHTYFAIACFTVFAYEGNKRSVQQDPFKVYDSTRHTHTCTQHTHFLSLHIHRFVTAILQDRASETDS